MKMKIIKNYDIVKSSGECASTRTLTRNCREEHHEEGTGLKSLRNIILWYIHDDTSIWYLILHQEWTARFETYIIYDMFIICDGDDSSISNLSVTCAFKKSKTVSWTECLVRKYFFLFHFFSFGHFWNFYNTHMVEAWEAPVVRGKPTICHMFCTCTRAHSVLKV